MKIRTRSASLFMLLAVVLFLAGVAAAAGAPNVSGAWNVKVSGDAGNASQKIDLQQNGNKITGTFKGPRQSGTIEGTVDGNHIKFRVQARVPLDYVGTIEGDTMKGVLTGRGKTGNWVATRASE
ncbi:MAG TPA: hypothetical protein VMJ93_13265 [Verrucomicrobiae bacterium]|nr:hypothetical protein [Verrucomicrobiae bacterium]